MRMVWNGLVTNSGLDRISGCRNCSTCLWWILKELWGAKVKVIRTTRVDAGSSTTVRLSPRQSLHADVEAGI